MKYISSIVQNCNFTYKLYNIIIEITYNSISY